MLNYLKNLTKRRAIIGSLFLVLPCLVIAYTGAPKGDTGFTNNDVQFCESFYSAISVQFGQKLSPYCSSINRHKEWVMFEGPNIARAQTRVAATNISSSLRLVFVNDPNGYLQIWLYGNDILTLVPFGFIVDGKPVGLYQNDEVTTEFLEALSNAKSISLALTKTKHYTISPNGSGAAVRYLTQTEPGLPRWRTGATRFPFVSSAANELTPQLIFNSFPICKIKSSYGQYCKSLTSEKKEKTSLASISKTGHQKITFDDNKLLIEESDWLYSYSIQSVAEGKATIEFLDDAITGSYLTLETFTVERYASDNNWYLLGKELDYISGEGETVGIYEEYENPIAFIKQR